MSGEMRRGTRVRAGAIRFTFDGREYFGQPGDTAASALLAHGVRQFGRSVKYRRLRGVLVRGSRGAERPAHRRPAAPPSFRMSPPRSLSFGTG